ncbi:Hypothetical predicted protein [Pelobates cultripes]|uniref:Uncharacterized protein n=1 Tax=Pelobates cultripes TaxID=61616 RepID=A0AAD1SSW6_PELCU|nr:Hypothetical predicted protein [Pelobates cultripes]
MYIVCALLSGTDPIYFCRLQAADIARHSVAGCPKMVDASTLHVHSSTQPTTTIQGAFERQLTNEDKLFERFFAKLTANTAVTSPQNREEVQSQE